MPDKQIEYKKIWSHKKYHTDPEFRAKKKAYLVQWHKNHPEKAKEYAKKRYNKISIIAHREKDKIRRKNKRLKLLTIYGGKCVCCEESNYLFLTIDHIYNDGKKDRFKGNKKTPQSFYTKIMKEIDLDKYQVLCWNCNLGKYLNGGTCPHQSNNYIS